MRECVSALDAGTNQSETQSLSTYAFLYGTIPTAPAVFVFSNLYQLEIDLVREIYLFIYYGLVFNNLQTIYNFLRYWLYFAFYKLQAFI